VISYRYKETKGENKMIWVIYVIWFILAMTCAVLAEKKESMFFAMMFLILTVEAFYIPYWI